MAFQVLTTGTLSIRLCRFKQFLFTNEPVNECDFFRSIYSNPLTALNHLDKLCRLKKALHCAGIKSCETPTKELRIQQAIVQVHFIESRDFKLPPGTRFNLVRSPANIARIPVMA